MAEDDAVTKRHCGVKATAISFDLTLADRHLDLTFVTFEAFVMLAGNNSNAEAQLGIRASRKFWLTLGICRDLLR